MNYLKIKFLFVLFSYSLLVPAQQSMIVDYPPVVPLLWRSDPPPDCPFEPSKDFKAVVFTGRFATYGNADTWYPSWASDGNMYSPWTDGDFAGMHIWSGGGENAVTGQAKITGDDPLHLDVINLGFVKGSALPYGGRYPCGSLVYDGVWYYGTYVVHTRKSIWDLMGPFVGFRISYDYGKTWIQPAPDASSPLFGESSLHGGKVRFGAPHVVDFGKNMAYSPDGKAYLVGHGGSGPDADVSWVSGDEIYMCRVVPSPENMNDKSAYEFFAGYDEKGEPVWSRDFDSVQPLIRWKDHCGIVTATYNPALKKYLMCITYGGPGGGPQPAYDSYILESGKITGPWKMIVYMRSFGPQGYFLNFPSRFISSDGKTLWLSYSTNWTQKDKPGIPPGGGYAFTLQEVKLLNGKEMRKFRQEPLPEDPVRSADNIAPDARVTVSGEEDGFPGTAAVDRLVNGYDVPTRSEWVSKDSVGAWIRLTWNIPQKVKEIWLFNRKWDAGSQIYQGKISFSDGSEIMVDTLPRAGRRKGRKIVFPEKQVSWLKFTVTRCRGHHTGLSEIAVFARKQ